MHPLRVESVVWVTERKGLLMALFGLCALHTHLAPRGGRLAAAPCSSPPSPYGLLAKPQAVVLPVVVLLFDWWPLGRTGPGRPLHPPSGRRPRPTAAPAAGRSDHRAHGRGPGRRGARPPGRAPLGQRIAAAVAAPAAYLAKTALPHGLSPVYPFARPPAWEVAGAALLLAGISAGVVRQRARRPWLLAGWLAFLALLAPMSNLFQVGEQSMADRYTYLPHMALLTAAVWAGAEALRRRRAAGFAGRAAAALIVAALAFAARRQTGQWRDDLSLFSHAVAVTRGNWKMHFNLGNTLQHLGREDEAAQEYRQALAAWPDYPEALNNLGILHGRRGEAARAEELFTRAVSFSPGHVSGWMNLGHLYDQQGDPGAAVEAFRRAVTLRPEAAEPRVRLGRALLRLGQREEALAWCRDRWGSSRGPRLQRRACGRHPRRPRPRARRPVGRRRTDRSPDAGTGAEAGAVSR